MPTFELDWCEDGPGRLAHSQFEALVTFPNDDRARETALRIGRMAYDSDDIDRNIAFAAMKTKHFLGTRLWTHNQ